MVSTPTRKELRALHQVARKKSNLELIDNWYGKRCACCKSTEDIEYHHIVPLYIGGTNEPTNIVPLCKSCHHKVHFGTRLDQTVLKRKSGGRKPIEVTEEQKSIYLDYLFCRIPATTAKEILGMNTLDHTRHKWMRCLRKENGISSSRNNLEVGLVLRGSVKKGDYIGYVGYEGKEKAYQIYADRDMTAEEFGLTRKDNHKWQTRTRQSPDLAWLYQTN